MFADSPLFRQINSDAHKIRAPIIQAPALTWHLGFLMGNAIADDFGTNRDSLKRQLDETLIHLVRALRLSPSVDAVRLMPRVNDAVILFDDIYAHDHLTRLPRENCTVRQIGLLESDQRVVNLRFRWEANDITVRTQVFSEYFTITVIAEVGDAIVGGQHEGDSFGATGFSLRSFDELTLNFWEDYTRFILGLAECENLFQPDIFQHVFADARGVIVSDECISFANATFPPVVGAPNWAARIVADLRKIVTQHDRYECSASYMLDGRALFLTALGPQRPDFPVEQRMPLTFLLCVQQRASAAPEDFIVNPSQLGRLIDRLLLSGTVRLAALLDLRLLRDASRQLSQMDPFISAARLAVEDYGKAPRAAASAKRQVDAVRTELDGIADKFLNSSENLTGTGLPYRVETSRYYVTQYRANLAALRIGRVEGYQMYDQFIERRLGSTFDFIHRLGVRYDRALTSVARTEQSFLTIQSTQTNLSIERIQKYGDIVLTSFLLPYYVVGSLLHARELDNIALKIIFIGLISVIMAVGALRAVKIEERTEAESLAWSTSIILSIPLVWALAFLSYKS